MQLPAEELNLSSRVHFVGAIVSSINLHQYFEVSVLSSRSEGFPNTVIEALAAGRAVVATSVGGVLDVVADRESGLLIPSEDTQGLTRSLRELRADADMRDRLGLAGQQRVRSEYSQRSVISRLQNSYLELAQHGRN